MIEGFAREMPESLMTQAIAKAHELHPRDLRVADRVGPEGRRQSRPSIPPPEPNPFIDSIRSKYFDEIKQAKRTEGKQARAEAVSALKERVKAELIPASETADKALAEKFSAAWHTLVTQAIRELILSGTRLDGRDQQDAAADQLLGRRVAPRARLGRVPARRDPGPGHRHARHRQGRAAGGRPGRGVRPEVHAALLLPVVLGGRGAAHPRTRPPRDRPRRPGRAERQAGAARRRGFSLHDPHHLRHSGIQRLQLDGHGLRLDAGPDGGGRADQQPGGRHLRRPGQGSGPLDPLDRHHRRRGPLRRHGFQGGRHAERHHRHPVGPEDQRHQRGDRGGHA